ncbi:MAG TPA: alpha/beta hydrolase [Mycobacteriales bacterium]|jgi:acetyl esterase|nr:alpha/beta hydrolase [Mycobacteriales bacterium]
MRSYGDPDSRSLPRHMRVLATVGGAMQRLHLAASMHDTITKQSHTVRQAAHPGWWMTYRVDPTVALAEHRVGGRGGPIRVRTYRPANASANAPIVYYIHGGGFMVGGIEACAWICGEVAAQTGAVVAAVEYRLAPEHPFPAGLEDCRDVLNWISEGSIDGTDPSRIAVAGDSAGGNLSAVLCLEVRDTNGPAITHQTLIYPFIDTTLSGQSWRDFADSGVDVGSGELMIAAYAGAERDNPLVNPLRAADLSGLPPALVVNADHDVLRDDGFTYAGALRAAGNEVRHTNYIRVPHGVLSMPRLLPVARQIIAEICSEIRRHLTAEVGVRR